MYSPLSQQLTLQWRRLVLSSQLPAVEPAVEPAPCLPHPPCRTAPTSYGVEVGKEATIEEVSAAAASLLGGLAEGEELLVLNWQSAGSLTTIAKSIKVCVCLRDCWGPPAFVPHAGLSHKCADVTPAHQLATDAPC